MSSAGNLTIDGLTIRNGRCNGSCTTSGSIGGGVSNAGTLTASNVTFSDNSVVTGGGISNGDTLTLTNSTLSGNSATNGGGINNFGTGTVTNSMLSNNSASSGGEILVGSGNFIISSSTLNGNSASDRGGGLMNRALGTTVSTLVFNSTFTGNSASTSGGAIFSDAFGIISGTSTITVINSTVIGNNTNAGAAVEAQTQSSNPSTITLENSIVYGNTGNAPNCAVFGGFTASLIGDANNLLPLGEAACPIGASDLTTNAAVNTILAGLTHNGGPTQTRALVTGSPAIDAGDATICSNAPVSGLDQRGVGRPQGVGCDIGAYEFGAVIPVVTATNPAANAVLTTLSVITVVFNQDMVGDASANGAENLNNYLLVERGANGIFDTQSCAGGVSGDDAQQTISTVNYNNAGGVFISTLTLASPLTAGTYRLFVCSTTSIWSVAGLELNNGASDHILDFTITSGTTAPSPTDTVTASVLPATCLTPNHITSLPPQPAESAYSALGDLWLEIPSQNIKTSIVGVPQSEDKTWDVKWLGTNVGWLNGTAFPSWNGNSVLTAHVTDANGLPGSFAALKELKYGDQIIVHLFGGQYIFEVRSSRMAHPYATSYAFQSLPDYSYLTLITCQGYNPLSDSYLFRRVARAVLVEVK